MPQKGGEPVRGGSKCQLKDNVKNGGEVHCAPLLHRRREANLLRRADGLIVQTVSQALQDALYLHLPGGLEENVEQHLALDPQAARLVRVCWIRPGQDNHSLYRWLSALCGGIVRLGRRHHFDGLKGSWRDNSRLFGTTFRASLGFEINRRSKGTHLDRARGSCCTRAGARTGACIQAARVADISGSESVKNHVFASRGVRVPKRLSWENVWNVCCRKNEDCLLHVADIGISRIRWPDNGSRHGARGGKAGRALLNLESHWFGFSFGSCGHGPRGRRGVMRRLGLRDGYWSTPRIVAFNTVDQRFGDSDLAALRIEC